MYNIQCQECLTGQDPWITIESGECAPIWPLSEEKAKTIQLRIEGTDEVTAPFYYDSTDSVLLMLHNKVSAVGKFLKPEMQFFTYYAMLIFSVWWIVCRYPDH